MNTFTVAEYAQAKGLYRQIALLRVKEMLSKGIIRPAETLKVARGREVSTYEYVDGSCLDLMPASPTLKVTIDPRFFSDLFNHTGWR